MSPPQASLFKSRTFSHFVTLLKKGMVGKKTIIFVSLVFYSIDAIPFYNRKWSVTKGTGQNLSSVFGLINRRMNVDWFSTPTVRTPQHTNVCFIQVVSHWGSDTAVKVSRILKAGESRSSSWLPAKQWVEEERRRHRTFQTREERSPHTLPHTQCTMHLWIMRHTHSGRIHTWQLTTKPRPAPSHFISLWIFVGKTHKSRAHTRLTPSSLLLINHYFHNNIYYHLHDNLCGAP